MVMTQIDIQAEKERRDKFYQAALAGFFSNENRSPVEGDDDEYFELEKFVYNYINEIEKRY
jgi:hypothetical protein